MQINSINNSNNFGMRLRATQDFWNSIQTNLDKKESKECIKALKKINLKSDIKDTYDIQAIEENFTKKSIGSIFFGKPKDFIKKGFELLNGAKEQVLEYVDVAAAGEACEGVKPNEFIKYISDNLKHVASFEKACDKEKAAQRALQAKVASCIDSVKID